MNPTIRKECNNKLTIVSDGKKTLYYSYETIIAFRDEHGLTISKNVWSMTTGKHLNYICTDKSLRIPYEQFKAKLNALNA